MKNINDLIESYPWSREYTTSKHKMTTVDFFKLAIELESQKAIAEHLGVDRHTVGTWTKSYTELPRRSRTPLGLKLYFFFGFRPCTVCKEVKQLSEFQADKRSPSGTRSQCKECNAIYKAKYYKENPEKVKARQAKYYKENPEKVKARQAKYYKENTEKVKAYLAKYRAENPEKDKARHAKYRAENPEKVKAYLAKYRAENPEKYKASNAKYRAAKLQRTVSWSDEEAIREIYLSCPEGHHVDHIIPLQGELVSGLHVETNLQYLTAEENLKKGNRYEVC